MSLCCFSQEQQQQRQSALLAAGDRALLVRGPLASSGFCLASCWQAVPLFSVLYWNSLPLQCDSRILCKCIWGGSREYIVRAAGYMSTYFPKVWRLLALLHL